MTKLSFTVAPVDLSAQGKTFTVNPADFHPLALEGIMAYGVRRWFQDKLNSEAHAVKTAKAEALAKGEEFTGTFDIDAAFAARLESALSGVLSAPRASGGSSPAFTDLQEKVYELAVAQKATNPALGTAWKAAKGLPTGERKIAVLAAVDALPNAAKFKAVAQAQLDALAMLNGALDM